MQNNVSSNLIQDLKTEDEIPDRLPAVAQACALWQAGKLLLT